VNYSGHLQKTYQFKEGLSLTKGNHSFRAGTGDQIVPLSATVAAAAATGLGVE
jgi:hypothetical protein